MSLLIRSEKDLPLLEKPALDKKLNKLSKTISASFAKKIYGEDPEKLIQFHTDLDKTKTVKVQFAKVKDHLLSKIHEARDTSFYNILALYFEQYFKLIKHGEKESGRMTDQQFDDFLKDINHLNEQLGIVYEPVYPEDYKGYILMQVDRSKLDKPPYSLTGTLVKDKRDDYTCKFTGELIPISESETFTDIEKHRQIKYIGGKEYYMSFGDYGAIYLQGNVDANGEKRGKELRELRARFVQQMSSGDYDPDDDDYGSEYGDDDGIDYVGDDYRGFRGSASSGQVFANAAAATPPPPQQPHTAVVHPPPAAKPEAAASSGGAPSPAVVRAKIPPGGKPGGKMMVTGPDGAQHTVVIPPGRKAGDVWEVDLSAQPAGPLPVLSLSAAAAATPQPPVLDTQYPMREPGGKEQLAAFAAKRQATIVKDKELLRDISPPVPTQGGGRRKKHKKSKKYYKKTQAKKRKKTKKR